MTAEDFTFAGVEQALANGLTTIVAIVSIVGCSSHHLEISHGWNYFKLLLETVERYIVVVSSAILPRWLIPWVLPKQPLLYSKVGAGWWVPDVAVGNERLVP